MRRPAELRLLHVGHIAPGASDGPILRQYSSRRRRPRRYFAALVVGLAIGLAAIVVLQLIMGHA